MRQTLKSLTQNEQTSGVTCQSTELYRVRMKPQEILSKMSSVSVEMTYHGHQSGTQAMQVRFLVKPRAMRTYSQKIPPEQKKKAELATHSWSH